MEDTNNNSNTVENDNCKDNSSCENNDKCKCDKNCKCDENNGTSSSCFCKYSLRKCCCLLSITACILATIALFRPCNKPVATSNLDESKIRSTVIDVIKNDPQMLIDAMSAGIVKQRAEAAKQQALDVNKYQKKIISTSYTLGTPGSKKEVICFFDPICSGCIDFQKIMVRSLQQKKDICFHILPVAALGEHSEEITKLYHTVYAKEPNKFISFIDAITQDISDVDKALTTIKFDKNNTQQFENTVNQKMTENIEWLEKLHITSVPCIFVKSDNNKFIAASENELIETLGL